MTAGHTQRWRRGSEPQPADLQILGLLAAGWSKVEVAEQVGLSITGLRKRLNGLRDAHHLATVDQLLIVAGERGWTTGPARQGGTP